jgi:hypothetical protein
MGEPGGAGSDSAWPVPGGVVASPTTRRQAWSPPLRPPDLPPRAHAESPAQSRVRGPRSGRAAAERAPLCDLGDSLSEGLRLRRGLLDLHVRAQDGEVGQREQGQGHMPVPAVPAPHFLLVEPHFTLRQFKTLLNAPALSRHARQRPQRRSGRRKHDVVGQFRRIMAVAPDQQAVLPAPLLDGQLEPCQAHPGPVIGAWPLRSGARSRDAATRWRGGGQRCGRRAAAQSGQRG